MKKIIKITFFTLAALFIFAAATEATTIKAEAATTTSSKTSTKKSTKVTKYKKNQKSKNTTSTTTKKSTKKYTESKKEVTQETTVKTTVNTKVKAKKKTVTTTVKTTVKTTKTDVAATTTTTSGSTTTEAASMNIDSLSGTIDPQIIKAFKTMNYKLVIDASVSYQGYFSGSKQSITLKSANKEHLLHELGHFVAFVSGNRDQTSEFKAIYKKEADKFTGSNKTYVTQSSEEYFAESLRDYYTRSAALKADRPETYAYIEASIALLTDARINYVNAIYYS